MYKILSGLALLLVFSVTISCHANDDSKETSMYQSGIFPRKSRHEFKPFSIHTPLAIDSQEPNGFFSSCKTGYNSASGSITTAHGEK
jgi:hypothetical protein